MATSTKPLAPGEELAANRMRLTTRERETIGIGALPLAVQQQLELRKAMNIMAAELAKLSWGKALDQDTRRAISEWGRRFSVDVTTELDLLGNRLYLNASYYLRRLTGLIEQGLVEYAYPDHIEVDPRLEALATSADTEVAGKATAEIHRRAFERIRHQADEKAKSTVVFRVKLYALREETTGCKWAGNGTRKNDPVGEQFPVESSESRAARRCVRQLVSHVPQVAQELELAATEAETISARIAAAKRLAAPVLDPARCPRTSLGAQCLLEPHHGPDASGLVTHRFNYRRDATQDSNGEEGPRVAAPADGMYGLDEPAAPRPGDTLVATTGDPDDPPDGDREDEDDFPGEE